MLGLSYGTIYISRPHIKQLQRDGHVTSAQAAGMVAKLDQEAGQGDPAWLHYFNDDVGRFFAGCDEADRVGSAKVWGMAGDAQRTIKVWYKAEALVKARRTFKCAGKMPNLPE